MLRQTLRALIAPVLLVGSTLDSARAQVLRVQAVGTPGIAVIDRAAPPDVAHFRPNQTFGGSRVRARSSSTQPPYTAHLEVDGPRLTTERETTVGFGYFATLSRGTSTVRAQTSTDAAGTPGAIELAITIRVPPNLGYVLELRGGANGSAWVRFDGQLTTTRRFELTKPAIHTIHLGFRDVLLANSGSSAPMSSGYWRLNLSSPGHARSIGRACGTSPLRGEGIVHKGKRYTLHLDSTPPGRPASALLGTSDQNLGPIRLPFDLGSLGAPTCWLYAGGVHAVVPMIRSGNGALLRFTLPDVRWPRTYETIYAQGIVLDPSANAAGLTTSNGLELTWRYDGR